MSKIVQKHGDPLLTLYKWIAGRVWLGTSKGANAKLHLWMQANREPASTRKQAPIND
jgi:hypothetical protein